MKQASFFPLGTRIFQALLLCTLLYFSTSCRKDGLTTSPNAQLATSVDTLKFDTVFTSVGSVTQLFKFVNLNDQRLALSNIQLMGGNSSAFSLNINGINANSVDGLELAANDSAYIFVTVNIDPGGPALPFVVRDSIRFSYNGNTRFVQLEAFGQNANFLRDRVIRGNVTWQNNLPYVILGSLQVDTGAVLNIEAGCRIYAHADAPLIIDGSLITAGTLEEPVRFTGDRLDEDYRDLPASWPGIYFRGASSNNTLAFTYVTNAYQALVAEQPALGNNPKLVLHQCIIDNAYDAGILAMNSSVAADNCLISNCGRTIYLVYGGDYSFTNCTVAGYSSYINRQEPLLFAANYVVQNGAPLTAALTANFRNCIFWSGAGGEENEVAVAKQGAGPFNVRFEHCLYKAKEDPANSVLVNVLRNEDPRFDSIDVNRRIYDFHTSFDPSAPGIDQGVATNFSRDLDNKPRRSGNTDLGCYEKQ